LKRRAIHPSFILLLRILYLGVIQGGVGAEREQMTFGPYPSLHGPDSQSPVVARADSSSSFIPPVCLAVDDPSWYRTRT